MRLNPVEKVLYRALTWTWPFYLAGALYVVGPVLGWTMGALAGAALYLGPLMRTDLRATGPVPPLIWGWIAGMAVMLVALWAGHLNWHLGTGQLIRSTIGWAKGWALLALFPLIGAVLPVRRAVLIRAQCVVGLWTLLAAPVLLAAPYLGLPERIFVSPLRIVGGPGPEYFTVFLFTLDPAAHVPRWQFYAPWSPFAALLGVLMVLCALEEPVRRWRWAGIVAGVLMILAAKSRMGIVGLVLCTLGPRLLPLLLSPRAWAVLSALLVLAGIAADWIAAAVRGLIHGFRAARADSTRVRDTLQRIAHERWLGEAIWFGHGRVEPGPHIVEHMPIGSHHTWWGLLFVKGLVGFLALLLPLLWHLGVVAADAVRHPRARLPLGILLTLVLLSLGENLEIEAYMLWPGLVVLGIHTREMARGPRMDSGPAAR